MLNISRLFLVALLVLVCGNHLFAAKNDSKAKTKMRDTLWGQVEVREGWWETSAQQKQGGFIGGEIGLGRTYVSLRSYLLSGTGFSPNLNVIGGYQWYFTDYPYFTIGLRLKGHFGYSYHGADLSYYYRYNSASASVHSFQGGIEPAFIWDILDYKKHTFGWYASPIGFEIAGYFGSVSDSAQSLDLTSYTKFIYTFGTGFHYYYNAKHLVFVGYRYREVFGGYSADTGNSLGFIANPYHSFVVGYGYKF